MATATAALVGSTGFLSSMFREEVVVVATAACSSESSGASRTVAAAAVPLASKVIMSEIKLAATLRRNDSIP